MVVVEVLNYASSPFILTLETNCKSLSTGRKEDLLASSSSSQFPIPLVHIACLSDVILLTRVMATKSSKLEEQQREPLIGGGRPAGDGAPRAANTDNGDGGFSWLTALGFLFLTFNSGMAIYRSDGDVAAVAFVGFSYVDLVLLFVCLRLFERSEPNSSARGNLKVAVWILTTLLTVVFSYKVAAIMPVPVKVLVWAMAGATVLGGFYAFFVHRESKEAHVDCANYLIQTALLAFGNGTVVINITQLKNFVVMTADPDNKSI
uniref:Uncharacterized protein n=1 Tax=Leersia perrieri TaxID=77586 RepID=A0A0D9WRI1_9ORYZ